MSYHNGIIMCTVYAQHNALVLPVIGNIEETIVPDPANEVLKTCVSCNVVETRRNRHRHYSSSLYTFNTIFTEAFCLMLALLLNTTLHKKSKLSQEFCMRHQNHRSATKVPGGGK